MMWESSLGCSSAARTGMGIYESSSNIQTKHIPLCSQMADTSSLLKLAKASIFRGYTQHVFAPYITAKFQQAFPLDLVCHCYYADFLKGIARAKYEKVVKRLVIGCVSIPGNKVSFLEVHANKTELFHFFFDALCGSFNLGDKLFVITDNDAFLIKPLVSGSLALTPCCHEEADSVMMLHAAHEAHSGYKISIHTVDTDVAGL